MTTGNTVRTNEKKLLALYQDVGAFSNTTRSFLAENGDNIIRVNQAGAKITRVLAKYAPEYTCLLGGIVRAGNLQAQAFRGFVLHINLELLPNQPRAYGPQDQPRYGAKNGPYCGKLPSPPWNQRNVFKNVPNLDDGIDEPTGKGTSRVAPGWTQAEWYVGSPAESDLVRALLASSLGKEPAQVSDFGVALFAPLVRGMEVRPS